MTEIVPLNSDRILLEATRRTDEISRLRSMLPDELAPLMLGPTLDSEAEKMSDSEIVVASALYEKPTNLRELTDRVPFDDVTLWRTVLHMRERGWIIAGQSDTALTESGLQQIHVAAD